MSEPSSTSDQREFENGATVFGSFEIISPIGAGAMGVVYKVRNIMLDKVMALKIMPVDSISQSDFLRFQNEARALSKLDHVNIARVYDFGLDGRTPYLSMDFAEGRTLQSVLSERKVLPLDRCLSICMQICDGLDHAHRKSVVHRDVKPGNIILRESESFPEVTIVDFGIAKVEQQGGMELTRAGVFIGSPFYASPEQALGGLVTAKSDMYSLGCVMFHCLTGDPPFQGETVLDTLLMHVEQEVPLERLEGLPEALVLVVERLLSKEPDDRFESMSVVQDELRAVQESLAREAVKELELVDQPDYIALSARPETSKLTRLWKKPAVIVITIGGICICLVVLPAVLFSIDRGKVRQAPSSHLGPGSRLSSDNQKVRDGFVGGVASMTELEFDDERVENVLKLEGPEIDELRLDFSRVSDLRFLRRVPDLKVLSLSSTLVDDEAMSEVADLEKLEKLMLSETNITDAGLLKLVQCPKLGFIEIEHCPKITRRGYDQFCLRCPNVRIRGAPEKVGLDLLLDRAMKRRERGEWQGAYDTLQEAKADWKPGDGDLKKFEILRCELMVLPQLRKRDEYHKSVKEILAIPLNDEQSNWVIDAIIGKASRLKQAGKTDQALEEMYKNCLPAFENSNNSRSLGAAICLARTGTWEFEAGRLKEAELKLTKSLQILKEQKLSQHHEYAYAMIALGHVKRLTGDPKSARRCFTQAAGLVGGREGKLNCAPYVVNMYIGWAHMDIDLKKYNEAKQMLEKALKLAEQHDLNVSLKERIKKQLQAVEKKAG